MQKGGSQYGVPPAEMAVASPRPPRHANFEEMAATVYPEDDMLAGGEEVERGVSGNRWPRQETLALLKIRSDMDVTFREATLKGPLWEEVSRKLAEQGYTRSAKKCKEKFENVHKYYKRTKDSRAARPDGKSYRFFSQLEALHNSSSSAPVGNPALAVMTAGARIPQPTPISSLAPPPAAAVQESAAAVTGGLSSLVGGVSFSSNTSESESETEDEEAQEGTREQRKRKRGGSRRMMVFFEGLMKQVMERQENMQQRFLETIEKREQDRMIREEAWRRQEMARISREHDAMVHERAVAASRDATIISFLQKISGQTAPPPSAAAATTAAAAPSPPTAPPPQLQLPQPAPPQMTQPQSQLQLEVKSTDIPAVAAQEQHLFPEPETHAASSSDPTSSRWPKPEVHALINIRAGMEARYQEAGPKGPLWEEISAAMKQLGYCRNAKRCKEKWENINKYFKKVKESNKKRPEDAKTCPYFHQLDALYRNRIIGGGGVAVVVEGTVTTPQEPNPNVLPITTLPPLPNEANKNTTTQQVPTSNGGPPAGTFVEDAPTTTDLMKKPEDIMKELMEHHHPRYDYDRMEEDTEDEEEDDEDDDMIDEEEQKLAFKIEFQRPTIPSAPSSNPNGTNKAASSPGSFLAMVHQ